MCRRVVKGKVLRIDRPDGRRVLRFDGPLARGLWWRLRRKFIKVSVTGLAFCVIWHDKHSADWLAALASPYPAAPDFPLFRGQNKTPRNTLFISGSTVSTGYCATSKRGKGGGASHQRGIAFLRPSGRLYGFRCPRQRHIKLPSEPARSVG